MSQAAVTRKLRCAVYTRKSTEEGLEQEFNSLDAQREAGEAYIASQRAEGWVLLPRPLRRRRLLRRHAGAARRCSGCCADIEAGLVDVVVVYKIDRLSRSLMDFAKLVEVFERHEVTFVSVTQQFNTTTSMGRLTLNILLSFAQFEREVIGERIRDKFAASPQQGHVDGRQRPARLPGRGPQAGRGRARGRAGAQDLRPLRRPRLGAQGGARAERGRRGHQALEREQQAAGRPRLDQGRHLQGARQPGVPRPGGAQGRGLSRRARRDRRPGALGPGARRHGRADPPARRHQPGPGADAAQGPDLRPERPGDVALAHQAPRPASTATTSPARRSPRATTAARSRACRRRTSRRRCWRRCSGC